MQQAISLYIKHASSLDYLIWILAIAVFGMQVGWILWARRGSFPRSGPEYERGIARLVRVMRLASFAVDLFPLLGLLGTVAALLVTFAGMGGPRIGTNVIAAFAPGLTSTITGLIAAIGNMFIFQMWLVPTVGQHTSIDE